MASSWKVWVVLLTLISITLLLLVVKLVFDKATRDLAKADAKEYLDSVETVLEAEFQRVSATKWKSLKGDGDEASLIEFSKEADHEEFLKELKVNVSGRMPSWKTLNETSDLGRKIRIILNFPTPLLPKAKAKSLASIISNIQRAQEEERIKLGQNSKRTAPVYPLPKFVAYCQGGKILSQSEWKAYYDSVGTRVKALPFPEYIKLMTEEALLNKSPTPTDYWIQSTFDYTASEFGKVLDSIWTQVAPLYKEFHAHLRGELRFLWEVEGISKEGPIPAHFFESPQSPTTPRGCSVLYEATRPYPTKHHFDLTAELHRRRYAPIAMATLADDFLTSIGFKIVPASFWSDSIFRKPGTAEQEFNCTPRMFQLDAKNEFRLSLCGESDERTLVAINRLMIKGALQSALGNESFLLRHYANPQIQEGIAEGLLLGMQNEPYLRRMGIFGDYEQDLSSLLNGLYRELFELFPRLTRALVFHQWEWDVYRKKVKPADYTSHYWRLRRKYEGVSSKDPRDSAPLDPAAHVNLIQTPAQNIQPLIITIVKYSVFQSLCGLAEVANDLQFEGGIDSGLGNRTSSDPKSINLQTCDLFGRNLVGERVSDFIKSATKLPPRKSLQFIFGGDFNLTYLDVSPVLNYFQPLFTYLKETNKRRELPVGW